MRPREPALIERLRDIVEFVEGLGKGIAIIENGDCVSFEDAKRVRRVTGTVPPLHMLVLMLIYRQKVPIQL